MDAGDSLEDANPDGNGRQCGHDDMSKKSARAAMRDPTKDQLLERWRIAVDRAFKNGSKAMIAETLQCYGRCGGATASRPAPSSVARRATGTGVPSPACRCIKVC